MRVVRSSVYRRYTSSLNDLQSNLNKSMNKVSTGAAYETAADNPLAYYQGKKMDHLYQDAKSKSSILGDIKNRLYQQEQGARDIQKTLSNSKTSMQYVLDSSHNSSKTSVQTKRDALLQDVQSMVSNLNSQYQDFYVYGGNDITTAPFSLSGDGKTLTYTHKYSDGTTKTVNMTMAYDKNTNTYSYDLGPNPDDALNNLVTAMREQGRVDIGYGDISNRQSLLDTYTGGLNMLTGLTSDSLNAMSDDDAKKAIKAALETTPVALLSRSVMACDNYINDTTTVDQFTDTMGSVLKDAANTEHTISTIYSDLGNKYSLVETTKTRLDTLSDNLTEEYKDILGADPYEAITEMFSYQYSYSAALKMGSNLMQSSLFDFIK